MNNFAALKATFDSMSVRGNEKLALPLEAEQTKHGEIHADGWIIRYRISQNEKGEYLDYLSYHRMCDYSHVRLYADGTAEQLPNMRPFRKVGNTPEEDAILEEEYFAHNRSVLKLWIEKGFKNE